MSTVGTLYMSVLMSAEELGEVLCGKFRESWIGGNLKTMTGVCGGIIA